MKRNKALIAGFLTAGLVIVSTGPVRAVAQGGGKAEPLRISFKAGRNLGSVSGRVRGDEEYEYVLGALAGQEIVLEFDFASRNLVVPTLADPDGNSIELNKDQEGRWRARLSSNGDYMMVVKRNKSAPRSVRYRLKVQIL